MQASLHGILLLLALLTLQLDPSSAARPTGAESPVPYILLLLGKTVGLPYFLLSTTGPLVQAWFAKSSPGASPYRLYALSNFGSLGALLSYPVLLEPYFPVNQQGRYWSCGFWLFAVLIFAASLVASRRANLTAASFGEATAPGLADRGLWFTLAASASVLLLAITNHVCQDIAVIPFLWVLPLSLYLLSFILCFEGSRWYRRNLFVPLLAVLMLLLCDPGFTGPQANVLVAIAISFSTLFVACMVCHGELVALRPSESRLTEFYLYLSAGGAFGGIFVALIAPLIFTSFLELQLSLFAVICCVSVVVYREPSSFLHGLRATQNRLAIIAVILLLGAALAENASRMISGAVLQTRNFYGILRLTEENSKDPASHRFVQYHGRILHGFQYTSPERKDQPNAYFGPQTGVGLVLRLFPVEHKKIGVVGLGVGTLAAYGKAGDQIRFYEINPDVISQTTNHFSFIQDSPAKTDIILGDGRLSLEAEPSQQFDILILDAFSGDAVPAHLLTKEAFELYRRHLKPDGVIAANITNSHLDLRPVLAGAAQLLSMQYQVFHSERDEAQGYKNCDWMVLTNRTEWISNPEVRERTAPDQKIHHPQILWTDAHNDLLSILK